MGRPSRLKPNIRSLVTSLLAAVCVTKSSCIELGVVMPSASDMDIVKVMWLDWSN